MNCIAVDDEPLALDIIEAYVNRHPDLTLIARCNNAAEASEVLKSRKVDLMFLDIQMPEINGLSFIKSLETKPLFVFTTAHPDFAVEGFDLNALDYLLKPIAYDRFERAIEKAKEYQKIQVTEDIAETDMENDFIFVKANQKLIKLAYNDIFYIEEEPYIYLSFPMCLHREEIRKHIISYEPLKWIEEGIDFKELYVSLTHK